MAKEIVLRKDPRAPFSEAVAAVAFLMLFTVGALSVSFLPTKRVSSYDTFVVLLLCVTWIHGLFALALWKVLQAYCTAITEIGISVPTLVGPTRTVAWQKIREVKATMCRNRLTITLKHDNGTLSFSPWYVLNLDELYYELDLQLPASAMFSIESREILRGTGRTKVQDTVRTTVNNGVQQRIPPSRVFWKVLCWLLLLLVLASIIHLWALSIEDKTVTFILVGAFYVVYTGTFVLIVKFYWTYFSSFLGIERQKTE